MLADAISAAKAHQFVKPGDLVVVTAGAAGSAPGTTNLIKVQVIERILTSGIGIGNQAIHGQVRLIGDILPDVADIKAGDVLVMRHTTRESIPLAQKAVGLIVVEGGMTSHAAQMALELGLTAIIGAEDALSALKDRQVVTLDPVHGAVYEGLVKV